MPGERVTAMPRQIKPPSGDTPRPAHRPRRDPTSAARVVRSYRLHPDTILKIDREAKRTGESAGQVVDRLAAKLS